MIFKAPPYKNVCINKEVKINLKLVVPFEKDSKKTNLYDAFGMISEKYVSETLEFTYIPFSKLI